MKRIICISIAVVVLVIITSKLLEVENLQKHILMDLDTKKITHAKVEKFINVANKKEYDLYNEDLVQLLDIIGGIEIYPNRSINTSNHTFFPQDGFTFSIFIYYNDDIVKMIYINDKDTVSIGRETYFIANEERSVINSFLTEFD